MSVTPKPRTQPTTLVFADERQVEAVRELEDWADEQRRRPRRVVD